MANPHQSSHSPPGAWTPQFFQPAPGHLVEQRTEFTYAEHVIIAPDGRVETRFGAAWRWMTTDSRHLPPAATASLAADILRMRPAMLYRPPGGELQIPWHAGAPVPPQLALPARGAWWKRLLGGPR